MVEVSSAGAPRLSGAANVSVEEANIRRGSAIGGRKMPRRGCPSGPSWPGSTASLK